MSALSIQVKDLKQELLVAKELHEQEKVELTAQVGELTEAKELAEAKIAEMTEASNALTEKVGALEADIESIKAEREASDAKAEELEKELSEAKAALEDPALSPVADAGADEGVPVSAEEEPFSVEKLKSLSGIERTEYFAKHKAEIYK